MDLFRRAYKRVPTVAPQLPTNDEKGKPKSKGLASRLAFLNRPLRLKGNSSISVPLGVVVLFPCIVLILILVLFVRHPSSPGRILMPAGAPPAIRYACDFIPLI
jgi:mannosyltransferase